MQASKSAVLFLKAVYLPLQNAYLFMLSVTDKLKVLKSVIIFDAIDMVNDLPQVKIATKRLSHDQTVFGDVIPLCRHRVKEIVWLNINQPIASRHRHAASPEDVLGAEILPHIRAGYAPWVLCDTIQASCPSRFPADKTCGPDGCASMRAVVPFDVANYRHVYILAQQHGLRKGESD